jgi:hypothetical protein
MAFCNSCGSNLAPGAKFCTKCGAVVAGAPSAPATTSPASSPAVAPGPAAPRTGSSAVKVILIVVGVVVIFGILGVATLAIIGVHIARRTHVTQDGNRVKVETPFGTVDTAKDPQEMAKDLGVDIYPGAQPQSNGSAIATFGGVRSVNASFISSDPVGKVCDFYRAKFPNAMSSVSSQNHCSIVSTDQGNVVTITIAPSGNSTKIQISSVNKATTSSK